MLRGSLFVGAIFRDGGGTDAGEVYVVFGGYGGFGALDGTNRQVLDLSTLTANQGFIIQGDSAGDFAGNSVSSAGDVNGDGFADLIIGAPFGDDGGDRAGEAYVIYGGAFGQGLTPVKTVGTGTADILIGGLGNDDLNGMGGADVFRSGAGDDLLTVADTGFFRIDGGTGFDTLALAGSGLHLDLGTRGNEEIQSIEALDITGSGANQLTLNQLDVIALSEQTNRVIVYGDGDDDIDLFGDFGAAGADVFDGTTFDVYNSAASEASVWVEQGLNVDLFL